MTRGRETEQNEERCVKRRNTTIDNNSTLTKDFLLFSSWNKKSSLLVSHNYVQVFLYFYITHGHQLHNYTTRKKIENKMLCCIFFLHSPPPANCQKHIFINHVWIV